MFMKMYDLKNLINNAMLNHYINIMETTKRGLNTVITQIFEGVNDTVFSLEKCLVVITLNKWTIQRSQTS